LSISALIPSLNSGALLERCLDALATTRDIDEVLVMDGGSTDGSDERAAEREGVRVISLPGTSIQARQNAGMEEARNSHVLLLNSDAFVDPETPRRLLEVIADRPDIALVGASLRSENGKPQKSGGQYKTLGRQILIAIPGGPWLAPRDVPSPKATGIEKVTWLPLCCVLIRRSAWREIGGWDERFTFYYEDVDFCRRIIQGGWEIVVKWDATAIHVGGGTTKRQDRFRWYGREIENRFVYLQKWYPRAWRIYAVVWMGRAWLHAMVWRTRAVHRHLRSDAEGAKLAREWARAFQSNARP